MKVKKARLRRRLILTIIALTISTVFTVANPSLPADAAMSDMPAAVQAGVNHAASRGVTQYVAVIDRSSGGLVAATGNAHQQVASESVMKLFIAIYYLRAYGGALPPQMNADLSHMIRVSDDATASRYWRADAIPSVAAAYGLTGSANDPNRPGYWGASRITAYDMALLLLRASQDPAVAGWLLPQMTATTDYGSDGYNQNLGFNTIGGAGSKQGWGCDSYWVGPCAIHSVGFTNNVFAAVLQTGPQSTYSIMPGTATITAQNIAAVQPTRLPIGNVEAIGATGNTVTLSGWAADQDNPSTSIPVAVYRDSVGISWFGTELPRADVNQAYGLSGNHGFSITLPDQPNGDHTYCVYAIDQQSEGNPSIGCRTVTVGAPLGRIDRITVTERTVTIEGWAIDQGSPTTSIPVAVYRNGAGISWFPTDVLRTDVNSAYGMSGNHGFKIVLPNEPTGINSYCLFAIDPEGVNNPSIGCTQANVQAHAPFGVVDAGSVDRQTVTLAGWAVDSDTPTSQLPIRVTRDGALIGDFPTDQLRTDVNSALGLTGNHGFLVNLANEPSGTHTYCTYAVDVQQATPDIGLGCRTLTVSTALPIGNVDATTTADATVTIDGWALDFDSPGESIPVAVYRNGVGISWFPTDVARPDVNAAYGVAGDHGFSISLADQPNGINTYCLYAIDPQGVLNPNFDCITVNLT